MKQLVLNQVAGVPSLLRGIDIARQLKRRIDSLKFNFFDVEKGGVNYDRMKNSEAFEDYQAAAKDLTALDLSRLTRREDKLAFWINIYNVLVVHGVLALDITKSVKEISSFFKIVCYDIGGYVFSLDDIEHGILRGNKKKHILSRKPFSGTDPRKQFVSKEPDPRIHFALVCGSNSCPPIEVYDEQEIDEQLELVADAFINSDQVIIEKDTNKLRISKIFKWYEDDFGGRDGVIALIIKYRYKPEDKEFLENNAGHLRIAYNEYDWSLNLV